MMEQQKMDRQNRMKICTCRTFYIQFKMFKTFFLKKLRVLFAIYK